MRLLSFLYSIKKISIKFIIISEGYINNIFLFADNIK